MISLANVATELNICKALAVALPRFYNRTQISAQITFVYNKDSNGMEISLGFSPNEPTEEQYSMLFEELMDVEKLLINDYVINNSGNFETIKQMLFKHKEETRQIIEKQKNV